MQMFEFNYEMKTNELVELDIKEGSEHRLEMNRLGSVFDFILMNSITKLKFGQNIESR